MLWYILRNTNLVHDEVIQFDAALPQIVAHGGEVLVHFIDDFFRRPS